MWWVLDHGEKTADSVTTATRYIVDDAAPVRFEIKPAPGGGLLLTTYNKGRDSLPRSRILKPGTMFFLELRPGKA